MWTLLQGKLCRNKSRPSCNLFDKWQIIKLRHRWQPHHWHNSMIKFQMNWTTWGTMWDKMVYLIICIVILINADQCRGGGWLRRSARHPSVCSSAVECQNSLEHRNKVIYVTQTYRDKQTQNYANQESESSYQCEGPPKAINNTGAIKTVHHTVLYTHECMATFFLARGFLGDSSIVLKII